MSRALVDASVLAPPRLCECGCGGTLKPWAKRFASNACSARACALSRRGERLRGESGPKPSTRGTMLPGLVHILDHMRWTNGRLAKRIGRDRSVVTYWFRGAGPTMACFFHLCRVLHCTPNELTGHDPLTPERLAAIAAAVEVK